MLFCFFLCVTIPLKMVGQSRCMHACALVFLNEVYFSVVTIFGRMNLAHLEHLCRESVRTLG